MYACAAAHLQLLLSLQGELFEGLDNDSCVGAVVHKDGRASHPGLQVVDGQRDVLGVVLEDRDERGRRQRARLMTHFVLKYQLLIGLTESVTGGEGTLLKRG